MAIRDAGIGDADMGLGRIVLHVRIAAHGRAIIDRPLVGRLPVAQQFSDEIDQRLPIKTPGDAEDRARGWNCR